MIFSVRYSNRVEPFPYVYRTAAKQLLKERIAGCNLLGNTEDDASLLNERLDAKIQSMM